MKFWIGVIFSFFFFCADAQQSPARTSPIVKLQVTDQNKDDQYQLAQLSEFRPYHQRYVTPRLTQTTPSFNDRRSANYWANSVTTQSYGEGKWGTLYYWDVQGNLRETKGFIDIAGKNKRGLKLVFPWR